MRQYEADETGKIVGSTEATPVCGESFCDDCGNCLVCYGEDTCRERSDGHRWVIYRRSTRGKTNGGVG